VALMVAASAASAETVYLTAAASVVGLAPFYSDVRAFNTSYSASLQVTADYRCFIGPCVPSVQTFTLAPRESRAFDDVCVSLFAEPNTGGAIEFSHAGAAGQLVVSSRLYSTVPEATVGMFVPGLPLAAAFPAMALTSVRNGATGSGSGRGFRTNVGVYNPNPGASATPTFRVYDGGTLLGSTQLPAPLAPRTGAQINDIFAAVGASSSASENAVVVVDGGGVALHSYAAVIDNATTDPIFVVGASDPTPPAGPQTVLISVRAWNFDPGGPISPPLTLTVGVTYTLVFHNVDLPGTPNPQHGFSGVSDLGLPPTDNISPGHDFQITGFTPQDYQRGAYPFVCTQNDCGGDPEQHAGMIGTLIIQ
jgi:hypothetical protein